MLTVTTKNEFQPEAILDVLREAEPGILGRAIEHVQQEARGSIKQSPKPSRAGTPPHTRRGKLPASIETDVSAVNGETTAITGPARSKIGQIGWIQEFGAEFKGKHFEPRPFMGPALERSLDNFASEMAGSLSQ